MKIEVTQEDIEHGIKGSKCYCPIARAINRNLNSTNATVFITKASITLDNKYI